MNLFTEVYYAILALNGVQSTKSVALGTKLGSALEHLAALARIQFPKDSLHL